MVKSQSSYRIINNIERAVSELRRGQPIALGNMLVASVEGIDAPQIKQLSKIAGSKTVELLISAARLGKSSGKAKAYVCTLDNAKDIPFLVGLEDGKYAVPSYRVATKAQQSILELMRIAELMPAAMILPLKAKPKDVITVTSKDIAAYEDTVAYSLNEVCRAPLNLKHVGKGEIIGFRPISGGREHYAIVVGEGLKAKAPLIRIHSSCYTGDLLSSLACDCGDQLHTALHKMADDGGGIVLYLMQEGRGIGLVNKLRTYALQAQGMDTVEANQSLGFADDERLFLPAAEILKRLGINCVSLLTNNPRKVKELERFGIQVDARVPHIMETHTHTANYMATKSRKLGHILPKNSA